MYDIFEEKYRECEKSLFLVAVGYLHNTEDAKDCVQEAALSAWTAFNKMKNTAYFKTWITRILINKCKNFIKKKRYTEELSDAINVFSSLPLDEINILDCICKLSPKQSLYITLRFYSDMTYEEAAKVLKQPISTVKYRTKKSLSELKRILEGDIKNGKL